MTSKFLAKLIWIVFFLPLQVAGSESSEVDLAMLSIKNTSINYSQNDHQNTLITLGFLKNESGFPVDEIIIEIKYFDAQNNLIDVVTQSLYQVVVPVQQEAAFKVQSSVVNPKESYASHTARVLYAERHFVNEPRKKTGFWTDILISWSPMLILILIYVFYMKRCVGKSSPQMKMIPLIESQTAVMEQANIIATQNLAVMERIAAAAEKIVAHRE